jgi:hypothetical protein
LFAGATPLTVGIAHSHEDMDDGTMAMMAFRSFAAPTQLRVTCGGTTAEGVKAELFGIQALQIN